MENVLQIENLTKKFGKHVALKDVSLTIRKGDIYGLIGRNGAGKTTLLKVITQLIEPTAGRVSLFGSQNAGQLTKALKRSGSVIESPVAYEQLTAYENLMYYCKLRGIVNAPEIIKETLEFVNLTDTGKKKFKNFSLGMKQKLGIAIAILSRPDFLILDEPINGLDPLAIVEFRQLIRRLNQEKDMTIIISSHILEELHQVATRFGIINEGSLVKEITKEEFERLSQDFIVLETPDVPKASQVIQGEGNLPMKVINDHTIHIFSDQNAVNELAKRLIEQGVQVDGLHYAKQSLESYFTKMVSNNKEEF